MLVLNKRFLKIEKILEIEKYKYTRYKIPFCLLLIEYKSGEDLEYIRSHIRKSDEIFQIDNNLFAIIFRFTNIKNGHIAAQKLINCLEKTSKKDRVYAGISCSDIESVHNILNRALFALEKAKEKNFSNLEDDYLF